MTDSHDTANARRMEDPGRRVSDLASRALAELAARRGARRPPASERYMEDFLAAALATDETRLRAALDAMLDGGIPAEEIVDLYIPEAARHLGEAWCEDGLGFAEVTIGTAWLQRLVRELSPLARETEGAGGGAASILVVVREGEFHTLGATIAASQLRRAGASVRLLLGEPDRSVLRAVAEGHYEAALLSAGLADKVAHLAGFVERLRDAAPGALLVGLGGPAGHLGEEGRRLSGVDFVSSDAREAVRRCGLKSSTTGAGRRATPA